MAWNDRIQDGAFTPKGGARLTFEFEDVSRTIELRGTAFEFPDADGTFVQRTGNSGRQYPLICFFTGDDCDLEAGEFEAALAAPGIGVLEHPLYGTINVVPFGRVARRDDLKSAANQTVVTVTFWDTIDTTYPTAEADPGSRVLAAVEEYNDQAAAEFDQTVDLDSTTEQVSFRNRYDTFLGQVSDVLQPIADTQEDVQTQFNAVKRSIDLGIDTLIKQPLTLASQTIVLLQAPGRAATSITDRLSAYQNLLNQLTTGNGAVVEPSLDSSSSNTFHGADLFASTYVSAAVVSVVNNEFQTRGDALGAAEEILALMDQVTNWRDANYESLGETDTGGLYQQLQEAAALAAGFLVQISFTLAQERSLILTQNRTTIDLVAELYGSVDDRLDFFSASNNLSWQEHLEISKGRTVVYYV